MRGRFSVDAILFSDSIVHFSSVCFALCGSEYSASYIH